MSQFVIEKNVPIPAPTRRGGKPAIAYPWDTMEVDDSFHIPFDEGANTRIRVQRRLGSAIRAAKKRLTKRDFTTRTDATGMRVWRVK